MIYSDNTATHMLIRKLGLKSINNTCQEIGLTNTVIGTPDLLNSKGLNTTTAKDISHILHLLYNKTLVSSQASQTMLQILTQQHYTWGIPKHLPKSIEIAHKTGTLKNVQHDIGIVFSTPSPYILTILTSHQSHDLFAKSFIASLSKEIYIWKTNQKQ